MDSQSGCSPSRTVKMTDTLKECFYRGCGMRKYLLRRFGMTLGHSKENPGEVILISSTEDSHARTSVLQEMARAWQESEAAFFLRSCALSMKYNRRGSSWKMYQLSLLEDLEKSPQKLPSEAMIVDGKLYPLRKSERPTYAKDGSFLPTPCARDYKDNGKSPAELKRNTKTLATHAGGKLNPTWIEWLMGYRTGWTELNVSVMQWFQRKQARRLRS